MQSLLIGFHSVSKDSKCKLLLCFTRWCRFIRFSL